MRAVLACLWLLGACIPGGCGPAQDQPDRQTSGQSAITSEQSERLVDDLVRKAGLRPEDMMAVDPRWATVAEAGVYEIGRACDQFLDVLFRFNRQQRAPRPGIAGARPSMAPIATSFGLSPEMFDTSADSVLLTVEPSALRHMALAGRQSYLRAVRWHDITSRPRMMMVLQGYLQQCSPAALEAHIDNASAGVLSVTSPDAALKAAKMAAPAAAIVGRETAPRP